MDVLICEMSPRDGLQFLGSADKSNPRLVPLEQKLALIEALRAARLPFIEVAAFVSPKVTPQMADSDALAAQLPPAAVGEQLAALVPNRKHYERFRATKLDTVSLFVSASESYSQKNMGVALDTALAWARETAAAARADGRRLRAHVSGAFQEVHTGTDADLGSVIAVTRQLLEMGCEHVALADTNGQTEPRRIRAVLAAVAAAVDLRRVGVHLHDRGGVGIANALAAFDAGVRIFDASIGGIGGSATASPTGELIAGNLATEELVELLERMGVRTGVDRPALLRAGELVYQITQNTGDSAPPSRLLREQLRRRLHWSPM